MATDILTLIGGIGLFLFGMQTMTGALRPMASRRVRGILARFTTSPLAGVATGLVTTALMQSSSATVMTVIGFVGAGLMTFPQALGVVLGANIGTTMTGWIVAVLGLKLHLGTLALPVLFAGAVTGLVARGAASLVGQALVGFSLIFLGLDMMQAGSVSIEPLLAGQLVSGDGIAGRIALIALGALVTAVIQASSAGVAATLVLLSDGSIDVFQAAALVIGMDVGTTIKSLVATVGGSRDMRRTAVAHVVINLVTAVLAFFLIGLMPWLVKLSGGDAAVALVAFHTLFNTVGVALFVPFVVPFSRFVQRLVPGEDGLSLSLLDRALLAEPRSALDAAHTVSDRAAAVLFRWLAALLRGEAAKPGQEEIRRAVDGIEEFLSALPLPQTDPGPRNRMSAILHRCDHIARLAARAAQEERVAALAEDRHLHRPARALAAVLVRAAGNPSDGGLSPRLARLHRIVTARTERDRRAVLLREHIGQVRTGEVFELTDAMRWLEHVVGHVERIVHYGALAAQEEPPPPAREAPET